MNQWIMVVPKNRSLKECKEIVGTVIKDEGVENAKVLEVRGEDVSFFVRNLLKEEKKVAGVTGEDLFREWQLENPTEHLDILRRYEWKDKEAMFGKPVLCLLGPAGKKLSDLGNNLKVAISDKYKRISKHYLNLLENVGYKFEKIYLSGAVESAFSSGIADLVIDIIYSGKSAKEAGLECYDKIFESDIVIIGDSKLHPSVPKVSILA